MLLTHSGNRNSVVLGFVIQYSSGEDTFSRQESPLVIILNSNTGSWVAAPPPFYFLSFTKVYVGLLISFSGHLGVWGVLAGVWGMLAGVWGVLAGPCQSPRALV